MNSVVTLEKPRRRIGAQLVAPAILLTLALSACGQGAASKGQAPPPPEVGVVVIQPQAYEHTIQLAGRVSAYEMSEVRPQIGGIVRKRNFREGATVRAGQTLYEIDPAEARATLRSAEGAATAAQARFDRYQRLLEIRAVSQQEFDDARAAADQANAALQQARINVSYTRVPAPISGVIGASSVTPGALASPAQATPFAVIQQIDRVYVDMSRSSAELLEMRGANRAGRATVRLILPDGSTHPVVGELQFSDVTVNEATGTVTLRALFSNPDHILLPGMFVQAIVSQGVQEDAILAPQQGVSRNAKGEATALVVNAQGVVEPRTLEVAGVAGDKWVVRSGLAAGDQLIVEGVMRAMPGSPVTPKPVQAAAAPEGAAPQAAPAQEGDAIRGRQNDG